MAIHPTAIVDRKAELDSSVKVGPYCVIEGHVRVAAGCRLYHGVFLTGWTTIAEDCQLHPGVIVGHEPQDIHFTGDRSYCRVGRGTVLREYVTIHRGSTPESETVVGDGCFLLGGSHVGHNCVVGKGVTMINNVLLGGHVEVGEGVTFGGGAGVHQFVRIGDLAMISGNARVLMDVPPFAMSDELGRVVGVNNVGLRRAGVAAEEIRAIRKAFHELYRPGVPKSTAADRITAMESGKVVQRLVSFLRATSRRGLAGRTRRSRTGARSDSTHADSVGAE